MDGEHRLLRKKRIWAGFCYPNHEADWRIASRFRCGGAEIDTTKLDAEILELTAEGDVEDEIQQASKFKDEIYSAIVKLIKPRLVPATMPTGTASRALPSSDIWIRLPKLTIRYVLKWTPFWDSYDLADHTIPASRWSTSLTSYLCSMLKVIARDAVSGLMLTAANYNEAVAILQKRFGSKQTIISIGIHGHSYGVSGSDIRQ